MLRSPNQSPLDKRLSGEAKFVNAVWCTPIFAVMITLVFLITWIPNLIKIITIVSLIFIHIIQFIYTFRQWYLEKNDPQLYKENERGVK